MKSLTLSVLLFCLAATATAAHAASDSDWSAWRHEATALYEEGEHDKAFKKYLKLGKKGDPLSQYRVSYMLVNGQGTRSDVIEALAWAAVAAQSGDELMADYRRAVSRLVPVESREKAQRKVDYYIRRWGDGEASHERGVDRTCTGSRLASSCDESGGRNWIIWERQASSEQSTRDQIESLNEAIIEETLASEAASAGS
jgi:TPR repeat protein